MASVNEDGSQHITPIGSLVLAEDDPAGYYIERYTAALPRNLARDARVCVYAERSGYLSMLWALLRGRFSRPIGVRLYGRAGPRRRFTDAERAQSLRRMRAVSWTRGYKRLFGQVTHARDLTFYGFEPIQTGELTRGHWPSVRPELASVMAGADHVDQKVAQGDATLRQFLAAMMTFPWWVRVLFGARGVLARALGLRRRRVLGRSAPARGGALPLPAGRRIPGELPLYGGWRVGVFTTQAYEEGRFWLGEVDEDRHLHAWLAVTVDGQGQGRTFRVCTVVKYKHWTGPLYFNLIRPFHHLVLRAAARRAARSGRTRLSPDDHAVSEKNAA